MEVGQGGSLKMPHLLSESIDRHPEKARGGLCPPPIDELPSTVAPGPEALPGDQA